MRYFNIGTFIFTFFLSAGVLLFPASGAALAEDSFNDEVKAYASVTGSDEKALEMKKMHFVRSGRYILSRLQEQREMFLKKTGNSKNDISERAEDLINEANMLASQDSYDEGLEKLVAAHEIVVASLRDMGKP